MRYIHPDTIEALDHIDAALGSGDSHLTREGHAIFKEHIDRWQRRLDEAMEIIIEGEQEEK